MPSSAGALAADFFSHIFAGYAAATKDGSSSGPARSICRRRCDLYDKIRAECEPCQKAALAPSRSRTSGLRAEQFGELTFTDHCQVPVGTGEHVNVPVILGGASALLTTEVVERTTDESNIPVAQLL